MWRLKVNVRRNNGGHHRHKFQAIQWQLTWKHTGMGYKINIDLPWAKQGLAFVNQGLDSNDKIKASFVLFKSKALNDGEMQRKVLPTWQF